MQFLLIICLILGSIPMSSHLNSEVIKKGFFEISQYREEEVEFYNGDIKFAGTLTIPYRNGRHPAVVMITGAGPQNRDEELAGMKPFRMMANHFTQKGIAVLRYDDRGVGGSTGNFNKSTPVDFTQDVLAVVRYLRTRGDINHAQIGLCGHSEGGVVAPIAASQSNDIAFIICMSSIGHTGLEIILVQNELIYRAEGVSEEDIQKRTQYLKSTMELVLSGATEAEIKTELRKAMAILMKYMSEEEKKNVTDLDRLIDFQVNAQYVQIMTRWYRWLLDYDPKPALEKVKCPVLLVYGGLDLQVPAEMSRDAQVGALKKGGNTDVTYRIFPKANHLFQSAKTGSLSEYSELPKEFVPGFLDFMSDWISERVDIIKD